MKCYIYIYIHLFIYLNYKVNWQGSCPYETHFCSHNFFKLDDSVLERVNSVLEVWAGSGGSIQEVIAAPGYDFFATNLQIFVHKVEEEKDCQILLWIDLLLFICMIYYLSQLQLQPYSLGLVSSLYIATQMKWMPLITGPCGCSKTSDVLHLLLELRLLRTI